MQQCSTPSPACVFLLLYQTCENKRIAVVVLVSDLIVRCGCCVLAWGLWYLPACSLVRFLSKWWVFLANAMETSMSPESCTAGTTLPSTSFLIHSPPWNWRGVALAALMQVEYLCAKC